MVGVHHLSPFHRSHSLVPLSPSKDSILNPEILNLRSTDRRQEFRNDIEKLLTYFTELEA